jgi:hypothetical protein
MTKTILAFIAVLGAGSGAVAASAAPAPSTASAVRALETARDVGRPYDIERDRHRGRGVWEVDVAPRTELTISADGKRIVRRRAIERSDDAARVGDAKIGLAAAVRSAQRRASGRLSEAELDREHGRLLWTATFERGETETETETEVDVDAATGAVLRVHTERDD